MTRRRNQAVEEVQGEEGRDLVEGGEPESEISILVRALMAEQRRSEEVRKAEEARKEEVRKAEAEKREEALLQREADIMKRQAEVQAETEERQYNQQVALLKLQAEMGEKTSKSYREMQSSDRRRDRALFRIPVYKEGEDIEQFLATAERRLKAAEIPQVEWIPIMDTRLSGVKASAWQDITVTTAEYVEARDKLLKGCGYTPLLAADSFFRFKLESGKGLTADQLYQRGQQLLRRMVAPGKMSEGVEYAVLRGWIGNVISRRARAALGAREVKDAAGLISALQDFLILEGERGEGHAVTFRRGGSETLRERSTGGMTCYKCGRVGHKAADCWNNKSGSSGPKVGSSVSGSSVGVKIICYTCGEEGHKSPQCPKNARGDRQSGKEGKPKPIKRVWESLTCDAIVDGMVNGQKTQVLLDSGAAISVVPEDMVAPNQLIGESVGVRPFKAKATMLLPMAETTFEIGKLRWKEVVAVAPVVEGEVREVLCRLDIKSERGLDLVLIANGIEKKEVARVTTRSQSKAEEQERVVEEATVASEKPIVRALVPNGQEVIDEPGEEVELEASEQDCLGSLKEVYADILGIEQDPSDDEEEDDEMYRVREKLESEVDMEIPPVKAVKHSREHLVKETELDPSLCQWRVLANSGEKGLVWEDGLLFQSRNTQVLNSEMILVLPKAFRNKVLKLAHDDLGHMGARRVKSILKARFSWPGLGRDVIEYCRSCPSCQVCAKRPARKVPMMERRVLSEPFEVMGFDPYLKERVGALIC